MLTAALPAAGSLAPAVSALLQKVESHRGNLGGSVILSTQNWRPAWVGMPLLFAETVISVTLLNLSQSPRSVLHAARAGSRCERGRGSLDSGARCSASAGGAL